MGRGEGDEKRKGLLTDRGTRGGVSNFTSRRKEKRTTTILNPDKEEEGGKKRQQKNRGG